MHLDRLPEAEEALRRASERGLEIDELDLAAYDLAFLKGDRAGMERQAARARRRAGVDSLMFSREAIWLAYSGRVHEARNTSRRAVDQDEACAVVQAAIDRVESEPGAADFVKAVLRAGQKVPAAGLRSKNC